MLSIWESTPETWLMSCSVSGEVPLSRISRSIAWASVSRSRFSAGSVLLLDSRIFCCAVCMRTAVCSPSSPLSNCGTVAKPAMTRSSTRPPAMTIHTGGSWPPIMVRLPMEPPPFQRPPMLSRGRTSGGPPEMAAVSSPAGMRACRVYGKYWRARLLLAPRRGEDPR